MIVPRKRSNLICGCGGIGRRARLRILCSQDMQVRVLSTAPVKPCDCNNHRVFSYHFAGIKTEWQIRKHRKQSKKLKKIKNLVALRLLFRLSIIEGEIGAVIDRIDQNETETQKHKMVPPRAKSARAYHFLVLR